ncbi:hypothetical protein LCGC14_3025500, partial [marine sediment metagenome]
KDSKYDKPFPYANGLVIAFYENNLKLMQHLYHRLASNNL